MAQACRIDFSKIVRARAARRADSAASFYRACTKTSLKLNGLRGSGRITVLQLGGFRVFWRVRDVGGA